MAIHGDQLGDAGRDYYARQFDGRIRDIRKPGAAPRPAPGGSRNYGTRGAIGGGIFALFILARIFIGCAGAGSSGYDSDSSSSYEFTPPPPPVVDPPPPEFLNNNDLDNPPWRRDLDNPPVFNPPPVPEDPAVGGPNDPPPGPAHDLPAADPDRER